MKKNSRVLFYSILFFYLLLNPDLILLDHSSSCFGQVVPPYLIEKPDYFQTLVNPNCSHCIDEAKRRAKELKQDDQVLCWTRGKSSGGAIPHRFFLNRYRVISDTYGVFVYDADAGYSRAFKASTDFRFHGWYKGIMVMKHKDGTIYSCLSGRAIGGPKKNSKLESWPSLVSTWGWAMKANPNGVAYHMYEKYQPLELDSKENEHSFKSRVVPDHDPKIALKENQLVLGIIPNKSEGGSELVPWCYPLEKMNEGGCYETYTDSKSDKQKVVILKQGCTGTYAAYYPVAQLHRSVQKLSEQGEVLEKQTVQLRVDLNNEIAPFEDLVTGSHFDVAGRCLSGKLKGWSLKACDGVVVKWYAWFAEFPNTKIVSPTLSEKKKIEANKTEKNDSNNRIKKSTSVKSGKIKEIAGTAELLKSIPKYQTTLIRYDLQKRSVILQLNGQKESKVYNLLDDAEIRFRGWWGRLEQFHPGDQIWVWLQIDRDKQPIGVLLLADQISQIDLQGLNVTIEKVTPNGLVLHQDGKTSQSYAFSKSFQERIGKVLFAVSKDRWFVQLRNQEIDFLFDQKDFSQIVKKQKLWLRQRWSNEGLPGTISFVHALSGEAELMLDHETMRWARSLEIGSEIKIQGNRITPKNPIVAAVKSVTPWRERTLLRLVIPANEITSIKIGDRVFAQVPAFSENIDMSEYPLFLDRPEMKSDKIEWFLASIYCSCGVKNNTCTGHFYTIASCNPNGCAAPHIARKQLEEKIDAGKSNRQIWQELYKERGDWMTRPHLLP